MASKSANSVTSPLTGESIELISFSVGVHNESTGYGWKLRFDDGLGSTREQEYRTNPNREGLFMWAENSWVQLKGTGQFSLPLDEEEAKQELLQVFSRRWRD